MSELAKKHDQELAQTPEDNSSLVNMLERVAMNPDVDVQKMQALLDVQERILNRNAVMAFNRALTQLQSELPVIEEGGQIRHKDKLISTYSRWDEDIHPVLRPILKEHGFSLSFRVDTKDAVSVEAVLAHSDGHSERTQITLPSDIGGAKNPVQAVASSVSYGKRYTAGCLLNLATAGMDDDGNAATNPRIDEEQTQTLEKLIKEVGADPDKFFNYLGVQALADLPASQFDHAMRALKSKKQSAK